MGVIQQDLNYFTIKELKSFIMPYFQLSVTLLIRSIPTLQFHLKQNKLDIEYVPTIIFKIINLLN